jgi:ribosomal protein L27
MIADEHDDDAVRAPGGIERVTAAVDAGEIERRRRGTKLTGGSDETGHG